MASSSPHLGGLGCVLSALKDAIKIFIFVARRGSQRHFHNIYFLIFYCPFECVEAFVHLSKFSRFTIDIIIIRRVVSHPPAAPRAAGALKKSTEVGGSPRFPFLAEKPPDDRTRFMLICCDLLNDFLWEFHACCWPEFLSLPRRGQKTTHSI